MTSPPHCQFCSILLSTDLSYWKFLFPHNHGLHMTTHDLDSISSCVVLAITMAFVWISKKERIQLFLLIFHVATLWVTGQPWIDYSSANYPTIDQFSMAKGIRLWAINKASPSVEAVHFIKGLAGILKVDLPGQWNNWKRFPGGGYIWDKKGPVCRQKWSTRGVNYK